MKYFKTSFVTISNNVTQMHITQRAEELCLETLPSFAQIYFGICLMIEMAAHYTLLSVIAR
jgi:hypothetical protein